LRGIIRLARYDQQMTDIILWLLLVAVIVAAWIEWIPDRYGVFLWMLVALRVITIGLEHLPEWYGWVFLFIGVAHLTWIYFSPTRRKEWPNLFSAPVDVLRRCFVALVSAANSVAGRMRDRKPVEQTVPPGEKTKFLTLEKLRNAVVAVSVVLLSPLGAIPSAIVVSVFLVAWQTIFGDAAHAAGDLQEFAKQFLEVSVLSIWVSLALIMRNLWITGPLMFAGGYAIAAWASGSGVFWRRYRRGLLLFGTIYPAIYVAAEVFKWIDMPYFD
jgi:hypothetical protein